MYVRGRGLRRNVGGREGKRGRGDCATSRRVVVVAMVEGGDGGVVAWRITCALA